MSTHLITGFAGKEHITSADQGSFNAAVMGGGEFVLERGEQFRCQVISNNKVRIYDGDALMQGRHIIIDRNTYEETTHDNGTQGYKRIDLIVLTYEKNAVSSVESVKLEVIKGAPAESNPIVPEYTKGDILNSGASKNQMPLYKIPFDGLSIGEPVKLFSTVPTLEGMKADVDKKVDEKIAEFEEDFAELEAGIEDKIAEAGKPLSSNAKDWPLIQNYGEYSADAKTVGEEFSKVNESLETFLNFAENNVKVGTWYNGKTLYRKVYTFNSDGAYALDLPQNVAEMFTLNDCVLHRSVVIGSDTVVLATNPYFTSASDYWNTFIDFTSKHLTIRQVGQTGTCTYVIPIYYTLNE